MGIGSRRGPAESETQRQSNALTTKTARCQNNRTLLPVSFMMIVMKIILQKDAYVFSGTDLQPEFQATA
jgi:hypothetical protein